MQLTRLSYRDYNWELRDLSLRAQNLIVGKNSVGKSRTLATIDLLVKMLSQQRDLSWSGQWEIHFKTHGGSHLKLTFATRYLKEENDGEVTAERIELDGHQVLFRHRQDGNVTLWNQLERQNETVHPPSNKLTLHANRDVRKYPYLEEIAGWADRSFGFKFGNLGPYTHLANQDYGLLTAVEDVPNLFASLSDSSQQAVIEKFNSLGYQVSKVTVFKRGDNILYVTEENLPKPLPHFQLSQGMFRSLAVLIYLEYLNSRRRPATIVIDDLCEGLDYARATKLGKLVYSLCQDSEIQLVATSNDNFLMEVVDIDDWNILHREGKVVSAINAQSHPALFERFRYTGLSNFDFFSSDFIDQHQS